MSSRILAGGYELRGNEATLDGHMSCGLDAADGQPYGLPTRPTASSVTVLAKAYESRAEEPLWDKFIGFLGPIRPETALVVRSNFSHNVLVTIEIAKHSLTNLAKFYLIG